jgi:NADH-quinone oxidoreductase subunit J
VALAATLMVIVQTRVVHALLYLIVSLLAAATIFLSLGAPFAAALEVIIYAGAILVLFVFVLMMLNLSPATAERERWWLRCGVRPGPIVLGLILAGELVYIVLSGAGAGVAAQTVGPAEVGAALFGPYVLGVELASMLLLAALVGAYHLARRGPDGESRKGAGE